jgi:hypothetical protein
VLDKLNASKGTEEYRVGEIFLSANPAMRRRPRQRQQDPRAAQATALVRRLCPAIFGSLDRGGRRRPRLGAARTAARPARQCVRADGAGQRSATRSRFRAAFDHRRPGHAQDPDRRSARRGAQPQAGLDQASRQGTTRARSRADRRALRRGRAQTSAAAAAPTRSPPTSTARSSSDQVKMRDLPPRCSR